MFSREKKHGNGGKSTMRKSPNPATGQLGAASARLAHPATVVRRATLAPGSLTAHGVWQLQRTIGNQAVGRLLARAAEPAPVEKSSGGVRLPDDLKAGVEHLSGYSLDDVRVHYNSDQPARLQALSYARGTDIHIGPGQQRQLPHETWHVVQQKQGRVAPTRQLSNQVKLNDKRGLEREADVMGARAMRLGAGYATPRPLLAEPTVREPVVQAVLSPVNPHDQGIRRGLIHGTYTAVSNIADLHVDAKGSGPGLSRADMLAVAVDVEQAMRLRHEVHGGPRGTLQLHPTGAAIVKQVVEMLGEALGGWYNKMRARWAKLNRAASAGARSEDRLEQRILPEHFAYLDSLRGDNTVSIIPRIMSQKAAYKPTEDDYNQDMMAATPEGTAKYEQYKAQAADPTEQMGAGLDLTVSAAQLPAIISLLRKQA